MARWRRRPEEGPHRRRAARFDVRACVRGRPLAAARFCCRCCGEGETGGGGEGTLGFRRSRVAEAGKEWMRRGGRGF